MKIEIKTVKLADIKPNKNNPRKISKADMDRLIKSVDGFPEMLEMREIVVDETMTVIGGNQRLLALKKIGAKEVVAKIVTGLSDEKKKEFIIKDNVSLGEWDAFGEGWETSDLLEWGVDEEFLELDGSKDEKIKQTESELKPYAKVHILISCDIDVVESLQEILDQLKKTEGVEIEQSAN
jgi:ParB-like chromosome segregation protein Spo0J